MDMLLTTTELVMGKEYDVLGLVKGATIQSKNIGKDFGAGLKSIVGGELKGYTEMMEEARDIAMQRSETSGGRRHCRHSLFHKCHHAGCSRGYGVRHSSKI